MNTVSTHTAIMYHYLSGQSVCLYVCLYIWMHVCLFVCMVGWFVTHNILIVHSFIYVVFDVE